MARRIDSSMRTYNHIESHSNQLDAPDEEQSGGIIAQKSFDDRLKHLSRAIKYLYAFALICFIVVLPANLLAIWAVQSKVDPEASPY